MHLWVLGREEVLLKPQAAGSPSSKEDLSCSQYEIYFAVSLIKMSSAWKRNGCQADPRRQGFREKLTTVFLGTRRSLKGILKFSVALKGAKEGP